MTAQRITDQPVTASEIVVTLREKLSIKPGMVLLVHSSLSAFKRYIPGGAAAVIMALEEVLGPEGTLIMPTQSSDLTDPSTWMAPPADPKWWDLIRDEMPAYDPFLTETRGMGSIPELFRLQPGVRRSCHPQLSFAAKGPLAEQIIDHHSLDFGLGEHSPLARMYDLEAQVLFLGTTHATNTSFHLAEYRTAYRGRVELMSQAPLLTESGKEWKEFKNYNIDSDDFEALGADFEQEHPSSWKRCTLGEADCFLASQRDMVDYAAMWLAVKR
ncbi:AAC(3) family N-acetyltransferase [Paenibacillus sp. JX-17]|uniref:Aminoglycoside N(3)-acetyltransferase n=1 Tax=Paenibacillus lacisoli TaxID=3064525 RepID=A0ABT9CCQ3_9BACL|nr:AAC(3) family N-acetyltransferase [Paenibacillus sp. JX-17]MDO7907034.1 AAC(3) family N-acetyltransferase [Paenibacillus sp. JX-17]